MNLSLLFWNRKQILSRELYLFRIFLVVFTLIATVFYTTPNKEIPKLVARSYRKINEATSGSFNVNNLELFQINMLSIIMTIAVLVAMS